MAAGDVQVVHELALGNMRRLRWLLPALLLLMLLLLAAFALEPAGGPSAQQAWRRAVVQVYLGIAGGLAVLLLANWLVTRGHPGGAAMRRVQVVAALGFLLATGGLAIIDQWVTPNISPYLLGCMSVSLLLLLPPTTAVWLFVVAYGFLFVGLGWTQTDAAMLLSNRANGFGATVLGMMLSFGQWRSNARYLLLQRELTLRNATLEKQQDELVWLATRDALTGLYNRREFMRLAELELKRAQRQGGFTSAIVIDLDHFKAINDVHGHPAGDKVLAHVAHCLAGGVRNTDLVARIGGEEFAIVMVEADQNVALEIMRRLCAAIERTPVHVSEGLDLPMTVSMGVAIFPHDTAAGLDLVAAADKALYAAKTGGRNRVVLFSDLKV